VETGLLYLFTTIAQCLAGAIALLAAFALYRLQAVNATMSDLCELLKEVFGRAGGPGDMAKLEATRAEGRYDEFIDMGANLVKAWGSNAPGAKFPSEPFSEAQLTRLRANMHQHKRVRAALVGALIATGIVMTGWIVALPFVHQMACQPDTAWTMASVGVVGFAACLVLDFWLIRVALKGR
jgi:hypothetical protein